GRRRRARAVRGRSRRMARGARGSGGRRDGGVARGAAHGARRTARPPRGRRRRRGRARAGERDARPPRADVRLVPYRGRRDGRPWAIRRSLTTGHFTRHMDQGLKERLIGAAVLIGLAVWLVPWVLDGGAEP